MKKTIIISLVLMFALTGCFKKDTVSDDKNEVAKKISKEEGNIMDWLKAGKGVECTIKTEHGEMKTYSKGDKVRTEGAGLSFENPNEIGYMISDGEWIYMWSGKKGTKMNEKKMNDMNGEGIEDEDEEEEEEEWQADTEEWDEQGLDYDCKKSNFSDSIFKAPKDVVFTDTSLILEASSKMGEEMEAKFGDMGDAQEIDMDELKKAMEGMNLGQ